jgi:alanyl-tRNA synthetase
MDTRQTLATFEEFFAIRGHRAIEGSTLIPPPGDPVLFTSAGMHPLTPYLTGRPHPLGRRLTGIQRCLRTTDLEEVGDATHLTVFQMLGSWSLGDYDGPQSQRWGLELLCDHFGLSPRLLYATAFGGNAQVGPDTAAAQTWTELGLPVELLGDEDNWWSNGPTGPCGPDSEIFVWTGSGPPEGSPGTDERWLELWNHVMMRYERHPDGSLTPLARPSIDTGMGLERLLMVTQGVSSVYETDLLAPWLGALRAVCPAGRDPVRDRDGRRWLRVIVDHLRSAAVVIGDGVQPSSSGRGYVLRRLIRRALTELWHADPDSPLTLASLPPGVVRETAEQFGQPIVPEQVRAVMLAEERRFRQLLTRGRSLLHRLFPSGELSDADYGYLHDTHGLPRDLVTDVLARMAAGD